MLIEDAPRLSARQRGDFQTPESLVAQVWSTLDASSYDLIVEPSFGLGAFFMGMPRVEIGKGNLVGWEIYNEYYDATVQALIRRQYPVDRLFRGDVLSASASDIGGSPDSSVLVVGNPPWVTNAEQGSLGGKNTGRKSNVKGLRGMDALTGKSNYDIAEAIVLHIFEMVRTFRSAQFALLVKFSVATNLLQFLGKYPHVGCFEFHRIDAHRYFDAAVDAGLFKFRVGEDVQQNSACAIYESIAGPKVGEITTVGRRLIYDAPRYERTSFLENRGSSHYVWRQGVKHDVGKVLELRKAESGLWNGFGEQVGIEAAALYPLYKGSDVFHGREARYVIPLYQRDLKDPLTDLPECFPKLYRYLLRHGADFEQRKSRIYQGKHPFTLFGIGPYTFLPYKVAIAALYTLPAFRLLGSDSRPAIIDDTCYMLATDRYDEAVYLTALLNSKCVLDFLLSISWQGSKRRFTKDALARIFIPPMSECPVDIITVLMQDWSTRQSVSAEAALLLEGWLSEYGESDRHVFQPQLF